MEKFFQVVVVGAGPGGSTAAIYLKKFGISVLLMDKAFFPRDKVCGDGIPMKSINVLEEIGFKSEDLIKGGYRINKMNVYAPDNNHLEFGGKIEDNSTKNSCIPRKVFDDLIFQKAKSVADEVLQGHRLLKIEKDKDQQVLTVRNVQTDQEFKIRTNIVIGADGANSIVARQAGLANDDEEHKFDGARIYYQSDYFEPCIHIIYDKELLPGYVWLFPVSETVANLGIMINRKKFRKNEGTVIDIFKRAIAENQIMRELLKNATPVDDFKGFPLPLAEKEYPRSTDGIILIGDAASFINPITGGGIYAALVSARKAAEVSKEAIKSNNFSASMFEIYEKWWRNMLAPGFEYSFKMKKMFYKESVVNHWIQWGNKVKLIANLFMAIYGRTLPKHALLNPVFWVKIILN